MLNSLSILLLGFFAISFCVSSCVSCLLFFVLFMVFSLSLPVILRFSAKWFFFFKFVHSSFLFFKPVKYCTSQLGVRSSPHNFRLDFTCLRVLKNNFQNPETSKICPDSNDFRKHLHKTSSNIQTLTVCNGSLTVIKLHQRWTHLNYALCPLLLPSQYTCTYSEKIWSIIFGIFHFWKFLLVP